MKKFHVLGWIFLVLSVLITIFIFYNSSCSADVSSQSSQGLADLLRDKIKTTPDMSQRIVRKTAHFTEFICQAFCICMYVICTQKKFFRTLPYILGTGFLTACIDESIQLFADGRSAQFSDVLIDFSGTVVAVAVVSAIYILYKKRCKSCRAR